MQSITICPETLLSIASHYSKTGDVALLLSGGSLDSAQKSILAFFPYDELVVKGGNLYRNGQLISEEMPWKALQNEMGSLKASNSVPEWIGYVGYEMGKSAPLEIPDAVFKRYKTLIVLDHKTGIATSSSDIDLKEINGIEKEKVEMKLASSGDTKESYIQKIHEIQELIREGKVYQVNLSQEFLFEGKYCSGTLFNALHKQNPAPFSAWLKYDDFSLVSSSPERLLQKCGTHLETRPIKGTAPRGKNKEEDAANQAALLSSEKEKAELLMITDLMRNDLGQISILGSVIAKELWRLESYANVHHMLSVITSNADSTLHPVEMLRRVFPGGSITGCPKLSAMEVIQKLEKRARRAYTGSIGYFSSNGDFDFNICIRTLICKGKQVSAQLGGAIVIDSEPIKEWEETFHKGESLFKSLN